MDQWKEWQGISRRHGPKGHCGRLPRGIEDKNRWKDSVRSPDETRLWVADGIAQGLRPWFTKFNAKVMRSSMASGCRGNLSMALCQPGLLSQSEKLRARGNGLLAANSFFLRRRKGEIPSRGPALGFYEALIEARIPFEMVRDGLLDHAHTARFRTLIFPDIAALSNLQCQRIRDGRRRWQPIVASLLRRLLDEWGVRAGLRTASLFGASFAARQGPMLRMACSPSKKIGKGHARP